MLCKILVTIFPLSTVKKYDKLCLVYAAIIVNNNIFSFYEKVKIYFKKCALFHYSHNSTTTCISDCKLLSFIASYEKKIFFINMI
ncbi:MAG: hypothetical protein Nk1A_1130 [Endomicrobiia bacterium]|nr:MAG: hypothetical protein Nk1A_1130 [Endomicrobiia bacterium]